MSKYFLVIAGLFICKFSLSQNLITKNLFFNQDSIFIRYCGGSPFVTVLSFITDTTCREDEDSEYFLAVTCVEMFGEDFFKKGHKYSLTFNRDYDEIKSVIEQDIFDFFKSKKNFFVLKIEKKTSLL